MSSPSKSPRARSPRAVSPRAVSPRENHNPAHGKHQLTRNEIVEKVRAAEDARNQEIIRAKNCEAEVVALRNEVERLNKLRREEKNMTMQLQPGLDDATFHRNRSQKGLDMQVDENTKLQAEVDDMKAKVEKQKAERKATRAEADKMNEELEHTQQELDQRNKEFAKASHQVGILDQWMSETGLQLLKAPLSDLGVEDLNKLTDALVKSLDHVQKAQIKKGREDRKKKQEEAERASTIAARLSATQAPVVRKPRAEGEEEEEEEEPIRPECMVCRDNDATMLFVPCGHLVCCKACAEPLDKCPDCQVVITQQVAVNL